MTILITGSNGLIGSELVKNLTGSHFIIGLDISIENVSESNLYFKCDVSNLEQLEDISKSLEERGIKVDAIINAHQYKPKGFLESGILDMDVSIWKSIIDVNLSGCYYTIRAFSKHMLEKESGIIINFASTYAVVSSNPDLYNGNSMGNPVAYSASKGGVISLTRYLAANLGNQGIRVNCITPHGVYNNHEESFNKKFSSMSPLGRMMQPSEILAPIKMLLDESCSYITGTNIMVDGGWTAW